MLARGTTLREIALPDNTLVMMVCRDGSYFCAPGQDVARRGDKLLAISDRNEELQSTLQGYGYRRRDELSS